MNLAHNFGEREAKSGGNSVKLIIKKYKGGVLMFHGQLENSPNLSTGKLGIFLILALFFHPSLPKIGTLTQLKTT